MGATGSPKTRKAATSRPKAIMYVHDVKAKACELLSLYVEYCILVHDRGMYTWCGVTSLSQCRSLT
jgi:hypothetical protein